MQQYVIIGGRWYTVYQKKKKTKTSKLIQDYLMNILIIIRSVQWFLRRFFKFQPMRTLYWPCSHVEFRIITKNSNFVKYYLNDKRPSWSWSYGYWIYNYLCNQCLSSNNVVSSNSAHDEVYSIQHYMIKVLSVTCDRSVVFSAYFGFLHQ
jgi:hypothetical protein